MEFLVWNPLTYLFIYHLSLYLFAYLAFYLSLLLSIYLSKYVYDDTYYILTGFFSFRVFKAQIWEISIEILLVTPYDYLRWVFLSFVKLKRKRFSCTR